MSVKMPTIAGVSTDEEDSGDDEQTPVVKRGPPPSGSRGPPPSGSRGPPPSAGKKRGGPPSGARRGPPRSPEDE
jgi:hypothetical protein